VKSNALHADIGLVEERIKAGVMKQRAKAMDKHWSRWDDFCVAHNVNPYLMTWEYPVSILQVFCERYRDGHMPPCHRPVKAKTVEDGIRAVGQVHNRLGAQARARTSIGV
jgi:hypothetical protein